MSHAIVFDCEFLVCEGAPGRFWCGPFDPDPIVVQIGAAKLGLAGDFPVLDTFRVHIAAVDRFGAPAPIDPVLTALTGITAETVAAEGVPLAKAIAAFDAFSEGARFWSWGKDEINLMAISTYVAGIAPTLPPTRFGNASALLLEAGVPRETVERTRSNELVGLFGIAHPPLRAHDARDDALSVAFVLQHLLREGRLAPARLASAPGDGAARAVRPGDGL